MSERGEYCYGKYKGTHRFAMDQVPGQVNVSNQTLNDIGTGECFLIGAKRDMRGRQCTYQVCVCAEGEQFVLPVLIFKNKTPTEDRWGTESGIENRKRTFRGETKREKDFYHKKVLVMWDGKAWFSTPCAVSWYRKFIELIKKHLGDDAEVVIQQDNLGTQNTEEIKQMTGANNIFQCNVPEDCTDATAVIDNGIGWHLKSFVAKKFQEDFESSPGRTDDWTDGKVPLWEVRILLTQWFGEAWEDLQNRPEFIRHCFKSCGFYNDIGGGENHLIHCRKVSDYPSYLRAKGEPPMVPLTKEEAENQAALDRQKRSDLRKEKRKARRKKNLEKRRSVLNQQRKPWR